MQPAQGFSAPRLSRAYASQEFLLFITNRLNSQLHQHPALQINLSLSGEPITLSSGGVTLSGHGLLTACNQPHRIESDCKWQAVLLLAEHHPLSSTLQQQWLRQDQTIALLGDGATRQLIALLQMLPSTEHPSGELAPIFSRLLQTLANTAVSTDNFTQPSIGKIIHHLQRHQRQPLCHRALADALSISGSHLSHLFRAQTGISLRSYKLWQRTMSGTWLLLQGKSITDASLESGFADTAHFSRSFKQQFGISPSVLRQHAQQVIWLDQHTESPAAAVPEKVVNKVN